MAVKLIGLYVDPLFFKFFLFLGGLKGFCIYSISIFTKLGTVCVYICLFICNG